jgi:hypothetical protein
MKGNGFSVVMKAVFKMSETGSKGSIVCCLLKARNVPSGMAQLEAEITQQRKSLLLSIMPGPTIIGEFQIQKVFLSFRSTATP